jgi:hypothetical protein
MKLLRVSALAPLAFVAACAAPTADPSGTADEAIRALQPGEIVGDIAYGTTSSLVYYQFPPRFRAFRFDGKQGDHVEAWVRSTNGDAIAWIATSTFIDIAMNDDAAPGTTDSFVGADLPLDGTYYIAFREKTLKSADFTVSLAGGGSCNPDEEVCGGDDGGTTADAGDAGNAGDAGTGTETETETGSDAGADAAWRNGLPAAPFTLSQSFQAHCTFFTYFPGQPNLQSFSSEENRWTELTITADAQGNISVNKTTDTTGVGYAGPVGPDGTWSVDYPNLSTGASGTIAGRTATVSTYSVGGSGTAVTRQSCSGSITF